MNGDDFGYGNDSDYAAHVPRMLSCVLLYAKLT